MVLKKTRNVIHLAITKNTCLRVILYLAKDKLDWYNDNQIHDLVIGALYPTIVDNLVKDQGLSLAKRQREQHVSRTIEMDGFRILYRFTVHSSQQTLLMTEKDFIFSSEAGQDEKPHIHTKYKPLSIYPFQLLVSIDEEQLFDNKDTNAIEFYFQP